VAMTERKCATCKHWPGTNDRDYALCQHPLPEWADGVLDSDNPQMPDTRGTWGTACPCWAERTADDIDEIVEEWWSPKSREEE
jgi:hypothetical protein